MIASSELHSMTWKVGVTYPNKEVKNYFLTSDKLDFDLPNIKWKCSISSPSKVEVKENNSCTNRSIDCRKKQEFITVMVGCCDRFPMHYSDLGILENKTTYLINLSCEN